MALAQHDSIPIRFQQQVENARDYLLPFISAKHSLEAGMQVLEIGCGEGGVLKPLLDKGLKCMGVDLNQSRIESARELLATEIASGLARVQVKNVYDADFLAKYQGAFDLILLKDTIEHIPEQERFIPYLRNFLKPGGQIFFGFPPWCMPFGGHQQICRNKLLGILPYYHLLPRTFYKGILRLFGEPDRVVNELMEIKSTGISLHRFERIVRRAGFEITHKTLYLFNPIYRFKFGLKPRRQAAWLAGIPFLRDFFTTAGWYLITTEKV